MKERKKEKHGKEIKDTKSRNIPIITMRERINTQEILLDLPRSAKELEAVCILYLSPIYPSDKRLISSKALNSMKHLHCSMN
jgi:hypothetical protein